MGYIPVHAALQHQSARYLRLLSLAFACWYFCRFSMAYQYPACSFRQV